LFVGEVDKVRLTTFFIILAEKTFVLSSSFLYPAKTYLKMVHKYFLNKEAYMPVKKVVASKKSKFKRSGYGWVPDVPDQRDYLLSAVLRVPAKLPPLVDLRPLCSKVEDQGQLG
jgi:hypothetical protein